MKRKQMEKLHHYSAHISWVGNKGSGTSTYESYSRNFEINSPGKGTINASSDGSFRGDSARYNPEELLVTALSGCHMLWFLHLSSVAGVIVTEYNDFPLGEMTENNSGGNFKQVVLRPRITVKGEHDLQKLASLHDRANKACFIANSCNFPVYHEPEYK